MRSTRIAPSSCLLFTMLLLCSMPSQAHAARLSMRFAGGGSEATLAFGETVTVELVWTMSALETTKANKRLTGLSTRYNVADDQGDPVAGLWMADADGLPGWELLNSNGVPFTEPDFFLDLFDPSGSGIAGNGTVFDTVVASFEVRNDVAEPAPDAFATFRHAGPADPLPSAENGAAYWSFPWQDEVVAAGQFDLGQGNPSDDDPVWDPYHGYETFQPLTIHLTGSEAYSQPAPCGQKWWTWTADFADGSDTNRVKGINIDYDTPKQISVNIAGDRLAPLPFLWSASTNNGTVVRVDTGASPPVVVGEYRTAPANNELSPGRTSITVFGEAWVGNREEGLQPNGGVVKLGLVIGGARADQYGTLDPNGEYLKPPFDFCTCVDRNDDGLIRTSRGLGHVLPWLNLGDERGGSACEPAWVEDAADECIVLYQRVSPSEALHVSVNGDSNLWVGSDGRDVSGDDSRALFELLDGETGVIRDGFEAVEISGGYGGLVDGAGILWSTSDWGEDTLLRYNPATRQMQVFNYASSGGSNTQALAIDSTGGIWVSQFKPSASASFMKLNPDGTLAAVFPYTGGNYDRGIAIHPHDGSVWITNSGELANPMPAGTVTRLTSQGTQPITIGLATPMGSGNTPNGISVAANGDIWVSCFVSGTLKRINPATNAVYPDPQGTVDLNGSDPSTPYNHGDMTGMQALMTQRWGMWTAVHDSNMPGAR